jgi:Ca-activated chloride channel homolog
MKRTLLIVALLTVAGWLTAATLRDPNYWRTADQRGDALLRAGRFTEAARLYTDPQRIGAAQFRNGDFESAARTFARVPGAAGAFDQGNALVMLGKYAAAIDSYNRALAQQPGWIDAEENQAIALARQARLDQSARDRDIETAGAYDPDRVVFDLNRNDNSKPVELAQDRLSDAELRATWLRQVQTTPGDFLRSKFAYQAAMAENNGATGQ